MVQVFRSRAYVLSSLFFLLRSGARLSRLHELSAKAQDAAAADAGVGGVGEGVI